MNELEKLKKLAEEKDGSVHIDDLEKADLPASFYRLSPAAKLFTLNNMKKTKPRAIIVDIDGTLAIRGDRSPFEWHKVRLDSSNYPVMKLVEILKEHYTILVFSGRDSVCREATTKWLQIYKVPTDNLFMRPENDVRPDTVVKKELFETHVKNKYHIEFVLDDRDSVVKMWREELRLPCFQVAYGDF